MRLKSIGKVFPVVFTFALISILFRAFLPNYYSILKWNLELASVSWQTIPDTLIHSSNKIGDRPPQVIAHAAGAVCGYTYTNSLDALDSSYARGFRYFEMDFSWTTDGKLVLLHDWSIMPKYFNAKVGPYSFSDFLALNMVCGLRQMSLDDLALWISKHPNVHIVSDFKAGNLRGLGLISIQHPEIVKNIIPQIYRFREYRPVRSLGYQNIILTLYVAGYNPGLILRFAHDNPVYAVTMPLDHALTGLPRTLDKAGIRSYVHTINDTNTYKNLIGLSAFGVYSDSIRPISGR